VGVLTHSCIFDEKLLDETLAMGDKKYFYSMVAIANFLDLNSLL
jgi:hypothetical protein